MATIEGHDDWPLREQVREPYRGAVCAGQSEIWGLRPLLESVLSSARVNELPDRTQQILQQVCG
jgi:hypothetical protein